MPTFNKLPTDELAAAIQVVEEDVGVKSDNFIDSDRLKVYERLPLSAQSCMPMPDPAESFMRELAKQINNCRKGGHTKPMLGGHARPAQATKTRLFK